MIYQPAEDSYLMSRVLEEQLPRLLGNKDLKFLEIGAGSGIHLETARKLGVKESHIFSVDLNQDAVAHCKSLGFNCIYSDLFENVSGKFDLIIFNPPYLPRDEKEDVESQLATTGGEKGSEVINRFLKQAENYLNDGGKIFLIVSDLTKDIDFGNFKKKEIGCEKLFFERLCLLEIAR